MYERIMLIAGSWVYKIMADFKAEKSYGVERNFVISQLTHSTGDQ